MIYYFLSIILYKLIINKLFIDISNSHLNLHLLFRSFFCFFISTLSLFYSVYDWNYLITNPLESTFLSTFINKLMLSYMLIDMGYLIQSKNIRFELIFHHAICIGIYGMYWDKAILAFCASGEILSAFNWIGILYPELEWSIKLFKLYSIILIRFYVWIFTLYILKKYEFLFFVGFIGVMIFICLDCYWIWVIISNYLKYKSFIKKKIISHTNKIIHRIKK
jgi:hypothetical protein